MFYLIFVYLGERKHRREKEKNTTKDQVHYLSYAICVNKIVFEWAIPLHFPRYAVYFNVLKEGKQKVPVNCSL